MSLASGNVRFHKLVVVEAVGKCESDSIAAKDPNVNVGGAGVWGRATIAARHLRIGLILLSLA